MQYLLGTELHQEGSDAPDRRLPRKRDPGSGRPELRTHSTPSTQLDLQSPGVAAGLVAGRLHLLAYALGASASGMTFADSLLPELLDEPLDGLLLT
jgi:hypothetical protein